MSNWILIESRTDWKEYKNKLTKRGLRDLRACDNAEIRLLAEKKIEHDLFDKPKQYPCLVVSKFLPYAANNPKYDHSFMYYETAVQLVDATEEERNEISKKAYRKKK